MARDRSPISKRLKSLAQRTGRSAEETGPESEAPASEQPAPPPAMEPTDDEQPTGEIPVVAEQPTDEQPAVQAPGDPAVPDPAAEQDEPPAPAWPTGPTMAPPVIPPRPTEPESGAADAKPEPAEPEPAAASPDPSAASPAEEDDEPFSPRTTIWPQSTPTPRFEPQADAEDPKADTPTFPDASPEPDDIDAGDGDDSPTISAAAVSTPDPTRAVAIEPVDAEPEAPAEAPATDAGDTGKTGVFGKLRRLRPVRTGDATETPAPAEAPAPAASPEPEPEPEPEPAAAAPLVLPASEEPPAKPSFGERASLRRRAKSLRARRDAGLLELGAIVLDQRRFGDPTGGSLMRRRTDELADIDSELAAIEQVLDDDGPAETVAQLGVVRCLTCSALLGPRDRFCVQCGAPRPEDAGSSS